MTVQESIKYLEQHGYIADDVKDMAIKALEKQIPKKPKRYVAFDGIERNGCPRCYEELGRNEILYAGQRFCSVCGQAIEKKLVNPFAHSTVTINKHKKIYSNNVKTLVTSFSRCCGRVIYTGEIKEWKQQ